MMRTMWSRRPVVLALCMLVALGGACAHKKGAGEGEGGVGTGEEGLGSGSLDRAKRGLGPEENGILKDVHFGFDSAEIDAGERAVLSQNVDWLRSNGRAKVELEGHCDSRGTIEYNLSLGAKRAKGVKDAIVGMGIAPDRVSTISYGKELPLCQEESDACWARNRRVHFVILGQ
jgi:peptidoglycan-associated lipoprotein